MGSWLFSRWVDDNAKVVRWEQAKGRILRLPDGPKEHPPYQELPSKDDQRSSWRQPGAGPEKVCPCKETFEQDPAQAHGGGTGAMGEACCGRVATRTRQQSRSDEQVPRSQKATHQSKEEIRGDK